MSENSEGSGGPSNVSDGFMKRLNAQRAASEAQDLSGLNHLSAHLWERIADVHRANSIEHLSEMKNQVERVDGAIVAMESKPPDQEILREKVKEALQLSARFLPMCQPSEKDEKHITDTKYDLAKKIVTMRVRAVVAFESFSLGQPRGPEKLASVISELVHAGLLYKEEIPIISEAIYPKGTKVLDFKGTKA